MFNISVIKKRAYSKGLVNNVGMHSRKGEDISYLTPNITVGIVPKQVADRIKVITKPYSEKTLKYYEMLSDLNRKLIGKTISVRKDFEKNGELGDLNIDLPKGFDEHRKHAEKEIRKKLDAANGTGVYQFNVRLDLIPKEDNRYIRGVQSFLNTDYTPDDYPQWKEISLLRYLLWEKPLFSLVSIYCNIVNFKNRRKA